MRDSPLPTSLAFTPCSRCLCSLTRIANMLRCRAYILCFPLAADVDGMPDSDGVTSFALADSSDLTLSSLSAFAFALASLAASFALCSATTLAMSAALGPAGVGSGISDALQRAPDSLSRRWKHTRVTFDLQPAIEVGNKPNAAKEDVQPAIPFAPIRTLRSWRSRIFQVLFAHVNKVLGLDRTQHSRRE